MKKIRLYLAIFLALAMLAGCSSASDSSGQSADNKSEAGTQKKQINVKGRYAGTVKKDGKEQIVVELVNADFTGFQNVMVVVKVEGRDSQDKKVTETLEAKANVVNPGEIKKVKIAPKKIKKVDKVTIKSVGL